MLLTDMRIEMLDELDLGLAITTAAKQSLRIQLRIPIEIVEPAVVQIVRREQSSVAVELVHGRRERGLPRKHSCLRRREIALAQIAGRTCGDHVFPGGLSTLTARDDVIEGQIVARCAVLADEAVAQEDIEAGEGGVSGRLDEGFQRYDAWELHLEGGTTYRPVIMLDNVHAIEKDRLDRVLPRPKRQRVVTQRPEIRIQHQHRPTALRDMCVQITLLTPISAAKQRVLTYYMQRDGIVKSVEDLIPQAPAARHACPEELSGTRISGEEDL